MDPRLADNSFDAKVSVVTSETIPDPPETLALRQPSACAAHSERSQRGLGPEGQRRAQVHQGQVLPARKDEKEEGQLPRRSHFHHSQLH